MHASPRTRRSSASLLALASILLVAACAAAPTNPSPSAPSSAPPSAPSSAAPSQAADPGPAIAIDDLVADSTGKDGQLVRVTGNFFADQQTGARLCGVMLESYPPQCGGGAVRLVGEVPAAFVAQLDTTTEPGLAKAWWGYVTVVGTYHAAGADGKPAIQLGTIALQPIG
jgi:hypothetical protein